MSLRGKAKGGLTKPRHDSCRIWIHGEKERVNRLCQREGNAKNRTRGVNVAADAHPRSAVIDPTLSSSASQWAVRPIIHRGLTQSASRALARRGVRCLVEQRRLQ